MPPLPAIPAHESPSSQLKVKHTYLLEVPRLLVSNECHAPPESLTTSLPPIHQEQWQYAQAAHVSLGLSQQLIIPRIETGVLQQVVLRQNL